MLLRQTMSDWNEDKVPRLGAALAFYTSLSIAPLLVLSLRISAAVIGDEGGARQELERQSQSLVGAQGADAIKSIVESANKSESGGIATALSLVTLLFGASGVFGQLRDSMNTIWEVTPKSGRGLLGFLRDRFLSFAMVMGIAFLLLVSLMVSASLAFFGGFLNRLPEQSHILAQILNVVTSFGVITVLFALMFKFVPDVKIAWKDVWLGAAITSILFTIGKTGIGVYLGHSSMASSYGAAGSLVVLLVWVYYSAQIVFFGAEFTQVYANRFGSRVVPSENAVPTTSEARAQEGPTAASGKLDPAVARYIDGWNRHDPAAVIAALDAEAIYRDPTVPAAGIGKTELLSRVESTISTFPDLRIDVASVYCSEANRFAAEILIHAGRTSARSGDGSSQTSRLAGCIAFEVAAGKIRSVTAYYDPSALQRPQSPAPAAKRMTESSR